MIAALRHTNIVQIYDFHISEPPEVDSTIAYMVMEYIEGQTYLYHIELHLNGVLASPGATQYQRNLAIQINAGINNVKDWLAQVRSDAIQLVHMDNAHLARSSSLTLLNDVVTQAHNAFMGRNDPATSQLQQGMAQIYINVQQLATFSVKSYS